jgi:hypothetical protein
MWGGMRGAALFYQSVAFEGDRRMAARQRTRETVPVADSEPAPRQPPNVDLEEWRRRGSLSRRWNWGLVRYADVVLAPRLIPRQVCRGNINGRRWSGHGRSAGNRLARRLRDLTDRRAISLEHHVRHSDVVTHVGRDG